MQDINPGTIIKNPLWPEPVILELVEDLGEHIRIVGSTTKSKAHFYLIKRDRCTGRPGKTNGTGMKCWNY